MDFRKLFLISYYYQTPVLDPKTLVRTQNYEYQKIQQKYHPLLGCSGKYKKIYIYIYIYIRVMQKCRLFRILRGTPLFGSMWPKNTLCEIFSNSNNIQRLLPLVKFSEKFIFFRKFKISILLCLVSFLYISMVLNLNMNSDFFSIYIG